MDTARLGLDHQPFGDNIALEGDDVARLDRKHLLIAAEPGAIAELAIEPEPQPEPQPEPPAEPQPEPDPEPVAEVVPAPPEPEPIEPPFWKQAKPVEASSRDVEHTTVLPAVTGDSADDASGEPVADQDLEHSDWSVDEGGSLLGSFLKDEDDKRGRDS